MLVNYIMNGWSLQRRKLSRESYSLELKKLRNKEIIKNYNWMNNLYSLDQIERMVTIN